MRREDIFFVDSETCWRMWRRPCLVAASSIGWQHLSRRPLVSLIMVMAATEVHAGRRQKHKDSGEEKGRPSETPKYTVR